MYSDNNNDTVRINVDQGRHERTQLLRNRDDNEGNTCLSRVRGCCKNVRNCICCPCIVIAAVIAHFCNDVMECLLGLWQCLCKLCCKCFPCCPSCYEDEESDTEERTPENDTQSFLSRATRWTQNCLSNICSCTCDCLEKICESRLLCVLVIILIILFFPIWVVIGIIAFVLLLLFLVFCCPCILYFLSSEDLLSI